MRKRYLIILLVVALIPIVYFVIMKIYYRQCHRELSPVSQRVRKLIMDGARTGDFVDFVKRISLKLPDSLFISSIPSHNVALFDSFLIFIDNALGKLFIFNTNGHFLKVYGSKGNGPGEFLSMDFLAVNKWKKLVYIYDHLTNRFTIYDLKNMNLRKTIQLNNEIMLRGFCVDSNGTIYAHHPPFGKYRGFITIIDSSGNFLKTIQTDFNEKFTNYYNRGFLNGDICLISNSLIIESNMFSPVIFIGDTSGNFKKSCKIPDYSLDLSHSNPLQDKDWFYKAPYIGNFVVNEKAGIIFQTYIPVSEIKKQKNKGKMEYLYYNVFDTGGAFLGSIRISPSEDIFFTPNNGDSDFVISTEPRLNERIPFNILVYKWKELK